MRDSRKPPSLPGSRWAARPLVRLGVIVLLLLGVTGSAYYGYRRIKGRRIEARIQAVREAGLPVSLTELDAWCPAVPPGDNAALMYTEAFSNLNASGTTLKDLPGLEQGELPGRSEALPATTKAAMIELLAKNEKALELLRIAREKRRCRYPIDLRLGYKSLLPHLAGVKKSGQLLTQSAILEAENNRPIEAAESLKDCLALANSLAGEPTLMSQLVRVACEQMACSALDRVLNRTALPDAALQELSMACRRAEVSEGMNRGFVSERCLGIDLFRKPISGIVEFFHDAAGLKEEDETGVYLAGLAERVTGHWDADFDFFLKIHESYQHALCLPFPKRLAEMEKIGDRVRDGTALTNILTWKSISGMLLPAMGKPVQKDAQAVASLRVAQSSLAVEMFRANEHRLPSSLDQLVPKYLPTVPQDPFNGRLLQFVARNPGYMIYSVGLDGEDDGGSEEKRYSAEFGSLPVPLDIVFAVER